MQDCLFCKIINGEIEGQIVYEDDCLIGINDINPQAPTHILVIPKKHCSTIMEIEETDQNSIGSVYIAAQKIARDRGIAESGFRVVVNCNADAGQSVFHIHFHLLGGRVMKWPPG